MNVLQCKQNEAERRRQAARRSKGEREREKTRGIQKKHDPVSSLRRRCCPELFLGAVDALMTSL